MTTETNNANNLSPQRLEANRRNAQLSTGPRTPEGKARVARNRTTHALTGAHTILAGEDPEAFENLRATLMEEHAPVGETEAHQVEVMAHSQWKLRRAARMEVEAFEASAADGSPVILTDQVMRVSRYTTSIRRSYTLALAELKRLQTTRKREANAELSALLDRALLKAFQNRSNPIPAVESPHSNAGNNPRPDRSPETTQPHGEPALSRPAPIEAVSEPAASADAVPVNLRDALDHLLAALLPSNL